MDEDAYILSDAVVLPGLQEERYCQSEASVILSVCINSLTPTQREVVLMRYFDGLSDDEIAAALSIASRVVRKRHLRALGYLREALHNLEIRSLADIF